MATSKQEQLYNDMIKYYDFADKLLDVIENAKSNTPPEQMEIVESVVVNLEKSTDQLTANFIEFVENGSSAEVKENIANTMNNIIATIEKCRNQIYALYRDPELKT